MKKTKLFGTLFFTLISVTLFAQRTKNVKIEIKPYTVACSAQNNEPCLQAKVSGNSNWVTLTNNIDGFTYEAGYNYKIRAIQTESSPGTYTYQLKKVINKKKAPLMNVYNKKLFLSKLNGNKVKSNDVYITIDQINQSISGKSGCNIFNLSYILDKKEVLKTYNSMGTLMACDESKMKLESDFLAAIQNQKFKISQTNNIVTFTNTATKQTIEFTIKSENDIWSYINNKEWKLIQLDNVSKDFGNAYIQFNVAEKRVSGNAGCNRFFGSYQAKQNQIAFSQVGATKMMCVDEEAMKTEDKVLEYLSSPKLTFDVADQTLNFYLNNKLVMMFAK